MDNIKHSSCNDKVKRKPWNLGKRKPEIDELGNKICVCLEPKLMSSGRNGGATCILCWANWYN